jgi:hypothetical protein
VDGHHPSVHGHERPHEREAHAQAARGSVQCARRLHEELEYRFEHVLVDSRSIVVHPNDRRALFAPGLEDDVSTIGGVLRGVAEQIGLNLLKARGVTLHPDRIAVNRHGEMNTA